MPVTEESKWRRCVPWCAAVMFCLLVDLAFNPAVFDTSIRASADVMQHFPPNWSDAPRKPLHNSMIQDWVVQFQRWQRLVRESWQAGRPPLWNELSGCGAALAANMQSEAYSPYLPVNLAAGEQYPDWRQLAQLLVAQISCVWLARYLRIGPFAALVVALGYSFTYYIQVWALHPHSASASFAPAILAAFLALRLRPRPARVVLLALLISFALLAGHIETAFKETFAAGVIALLWTPRRALDLGGRFRFTGHEHALVVSLIPPGVDEPEGVHRVRRYDAVESRRFIDMLWQPPISPFGRNFEISFARSEILNAMAVGWLLTPFPAATVVRPLKKHGLKGGESMVLPSRTGVELLFFRPGGRAGDGTVTLKRSGEAPLSATIGQPDPANPLVVTKMDPGVEHFERTYFQAGACEFTRVLPSATEETITVAVKEGVAPIEIFELGRHGLGEELAERDSIKGWLRITERLTRMPLAYMANHVVKTSCRQRAMEFIRAPNWTPRKLTVIEVEEFDPDEPISRKGSEIAPAALIRESAEAFRVIFPDQQGGVLVLAESYAPGWYCRHGKGETEAVPANVGMMAFRIPPGVVEARIEYRPRSFVFGVWISLTTLLVMLILVTRDLLATRKAARLQRGPDQAAIVDVAVRPGVEASAGPTLDNRALNP